MKKPLISTFSIGLGVFSLVVAFAASAVVGLPSVGAVEDDSPTSSEVRDETEQETENENVETTELRTRTIERLGEYESKSAERARELQQKAEERAEELRAKAQELEQKREEVQTRLTERRLEACKKREERIGEIISKISEQGKRQLELFDKIADRTQAFYEAAGNTLDTYDELVAAVDSARSNAESAVIDVEAAGATFECDGTDPIGTAEAIKTNLRLRIESLKAYRTSVKNLIVGVKSVQPDVDDADNEEVKNDDSSTEQTEEN